MSNIDRNYAATGGSIGGDRAIPVDAGLSAKSKHKENKEMRRFLIGMLIGFGIGVLGTSPTLTAPVSGLVIGKATQLGQVAE
jgi:hypothetical protein